MGLAQAKRSGMHGGRRHSGIREKAAAKPVVNDMEHEQTRGIGDHPNKHKTADFRMSGNRRFEASVGTLALLGGLCKRRFYLKVM